MQFGYLPLPDFSLSNMSEQNFSSATSLDLVTDFEERPAAIKAMGWWHWGKIGRSSIRVVGPGAEKGLVGIPPYGDSYLTYVTFTLPGDTYVLWQPCDKMCFTIGIDDFIVQYHRWIQPWRERGCETIEELYRVVVSRILAFNRVDADFQTPKKVPMIPQSKTVVTADENLVRTHCAKRRVTSDGREVKMWECGLCGKEFKFQYTLSRHIPTHTDVRNYRCDICPKAFRQLSTLAQHKVTHKDERPYVCENCGKAFNRVSTLMSHKRTHYDDKRHVCKYCGKGFHQKGNLRNHVNTHTDERPFKCDVCNKGFNQQSNLVCHKENAHPKKSHFCEKCLTIFPRRSSFLSHMRKHHVRRGESQPVSVITVKSTSEAHSNKTFNNNDGEMILPDPEIPSTSNNCPIRSFNDTKDWTNIIVKPITSSHPSRLNVPWQENPGLSPQKQEHCVKLRIKEEPDAAWIEPILGSLTPLKVEVYVKQEEQTSSLPYVKPQEQTPSLLSVKPEEQTSSLPEVLSPIDPLLAIGLSEFKENPESYNPHNVQVQKLLNIPEEVDFETALLNDINKPFDIGDFEFFDDLM